ncbi:Methionine--tRNA ligase [Candidatus Hodgkinia cicadicola]|uniref:Methionine--tRNA ligase n=1 Tax=Candidatus Hodgkinia cicadicola TaxID=573658 RepID=A0A097GZU5_9HYPH|nr:Methionine--tRNA ligase [Candidatus Hodgkinia cicadicola]AUG34021.1 Methionine--tRNA ligase [Candidatus Hodgkinia cicadicola]
MYWVYTSLIYTDAPPHVGHLYELSVANALCECIKNWHSVKLAAGADDHGAKIQNLSKNKNINPTKVSNLNSNKILAMCSKYKINVKDWISTSYPRHTKLVASKIKQINAANAISKLDYCGWYSPQLDCYRGSDHVQFSKNLLYCANNAPVEWTEERGAFINFSRAKPKLLAIHRASLVAIPYINVNSAFRIINSTEDVCITRDKTTSYGIKLITQNLKLVLWVWIDAILAYINANRRNKVHIIGKDITKFHLTHYVALSLLLSTKLPKAILQHVYINTLKTKVSKSLKNQPSGASFRTCALYYYLCTRSFRNDIELNESGLAAAFAKLTNNMGNLAKRIIKLRTLNRLKLRQLTISEWIIVLYVKRLTTTLGHLVKSFKLNETNSTILDGTAKINSAISNYKLWHNARAGHKLFVYAFAAKRHIHWLKFAIGGNAESMILNINSANTKYVPFPKLA